MAIKITDKGKKIFNDTVETYNGFLEQCEITEDEFLRLKGIQYEVDFDNERIYVSALNEKNERYELPINFHLKDKCIAQWIFAYMCVKTNTFEELQKWEAKFNEK